MNSGVDTSASGIGEGRFEGVSPVFTEVQLISEGDINILGKGKRYGRWWLLKGLQPDLSELTQYVEMLHKEFELLMKAQHPGIVQATSLEEVPGLGECIVMEYVEGTTLKEVMEQGLSSRTAARLMDELTDAVAYIHSLGIVHRDLKPSNVIVTQGGHVKLIDFGLADTRAHAFLKQSAGTERYMSPEQAAGGKPDARNDIYSLGVIMQGMPLPWSYRRSIARCLCPIERRWESVEEMKESIVARRLLVRRMAYVAVAAVMLAVAFVAGVSLQHRASERDFDAWRASHADSEMMAVTADSLAVQLQERDAEIAALHSNVQQMEQTMQRSNDSMKQVIATMDADAVAGRQKAKVVGAWEMRLRQQVEATRLEQMLDTLTRWEEPWVTRVTRSIMDVNRAMRQYIDNLGNTYDEREMADIKDTLLPMLKAWNDSMAEKIRKVKERAQKSSEM